MVKKKLLQGIDTIIVRVSDIESSKKWYEEKLKLTPIWDDSNIKLVVFDTGSPTSLTIWQTDKLIENNKETSSYPIFRTFDAQIARQELQEKGVNVGEVINDNFVKYFFFYDPDGNVLEACQVH
ncbi:MAG: glyoxalase/bleomycin resistance/extradiol dioxygenase family protein [Chlorobiaceae bacterium]|nr:glyoxalase/bleomycin resistance/extradiol dioxygenase family protein [Chlorobiaceae bacterium]MBA4310116.1 glyoxalase/bleomycin resistance/extradiol dioxygenase family protein [Chlorobiaceae bacterium]